MGDAEKWLAKARNSKAGWRARDVERLYRAWGFVVAPGGRDTRYVHPDHPDLVAFVTRSSGDVSKGYIQDAVEVIEDLISRGYKP